jgi:pimeloyl-ACP methyl ester carboxylesterase
MQPTRSSEALTLQERRVELDGIETRALDLEGSGPPLLLLHGYADSADTWRPLMERLGRQERAATAIDLTGFGTCSDLDLGKPLLPQWDGMVAAAIEELSDRHSGGEVFVVGNSLGGCLSLRAAQNPELPIGGIVPIAPAGLHMARWFPVIESERLIRLLRLSPFPVPEAVVREIVARVYRTLAFNDPRGANPDVVSSFARHIGTIERSMAVLDVGRRLLPELEDPFELRLIDCPLLLVWGERDKMVYTAGAERVLRTVDYSDIEVIPDCGHCPQVEEPDRLAELLEAFPDSLDEP